MAGLNYSLLPGTGMDIVMTGLSYSILLTTGMDVVMTGLSYCLLPGTGLDIVRTGLSHTLLSSTGPVLVRTRLSHPSSLVQGWIYSGQGSATVSLHRDGYIQDSGKLHSPPCYRVDIVRIGLSYSSFLLKGRI